MEENKNKIKEFSTVIDAYAVKTTKLAQTVLTHSNTLLSKQDFIQKYEDLAHQIKKLEYLCADI
jgi:flagellar biosynthesis component FlhA